MRRKPTRLCVACHRHVFVALVKRSPLASLKELGQLAEPELGWCPSYAEVSAFVRWCGIKVLTPAERADWRSLEAQREAARAAAGAKRRAGKREPLVRPEHRALASMASIFSLAQEVDR